MRFVLLGSRETITRKNDSRRYLWTNMEGQHNIIWYENKLDIEVFLYYMKNN